MSGPIEIQGGVTGAAEVVARFRDAETKVAERLRKVIRSQGRNLQAMVKEEYLRGPRPQHLGVKSGRLSRSVNLELTSTADEERASVGTNVEYGRYWELGFHGEESVKAHTRKQKIVAQGLQFSKPRLRKDGTMSSPTARRAKNRDVKSAVPVKAHKRRVDQAPRPFLKPALARVKQSAGDAIAAELAKGL